MSHSTRATLSQSTIHRLRILGICVFLLAFVLPGCRLTGLSNSFMGWRCAWLAFDFPASAIHEAIVHTPDADLKLFPEAPLSFMSGCINLMIPVYLWLAFKSRAAGVRRRLAWATLVCIVATWVLFYLFPLTPLIGHFLWIVGILLILSGELVQPPEAADSPLLP